MIAHRCHNCIWWDNQHPSAVHLKPPAYLCKLEPGFCRKHRPGAIQVEGFHYGVQPIMDADEFCGEFRIK